VAMADEDDEDFEERVAYTFAQMDSNNSGAVNYMQLRKWISAQMKADEDVEAKGITDEMQEASTDAFAQYKRHSDDMLGVGEVAELLRALDLLKYMPEEVLLRLLHCCLCVSCTLSIGVLRCRFRSRSRSPCRKGSVLKS
jgi:hypothetical protein